MIDIYSYLCSKYCASYVVEHVVLRFNGHYSLCYACILIYYVSGGRSHVYFKSAEVSSFQGIRIMYTEVFSLHGVVPPCVLPLLSYHMQEIKWCPLYSGINNISIYRCSICTELHSC